MEYSIASALEDRSEIYDVPYPPLQSDPALDCVNPGLGQIVSLYQTVVPMPSSSSSLHTIEKKTQESSDEIFVNSNLSIQSGTGKESVDSTILQSFQNPIITDSIIFPKEEMKPKKHKIDDASTGPFQGKKKKLEHKFKVV